MRRLPLLTVGTGRLNSRNSLYFSLLAGNLAGEGLAADCLLRQTVSTAEKLCSVVPEISEKGRVFAVFPRETGPEKIIDERPCSRCSGFSPEPTLVVRFQEPAQANA